MRELKIVSALAHKMYLYERFDTYHGDVRSGVI